LCAEHRNGRDEPSDDAAGNLASDSRKELRYREPLVYEKQRL
jgi:hypothetical protein